MDQINNLYPLIPPTPQVEKLQELKQNSENANQQKKQMDHEKKKGKTLGGESPLRMKGNARLTSGSERTRGLPTEDPLSPQDGQDHKIDIFV